MDWWNYFFALKQDKSNIDNQRNSGFLRFSGYFLALQGQGYAKLKELDW